jgi:hypothetical protein
MVMKHEFGANKMKRFLKYELDKYLRGRAVEQKKERPLYRVENQSYVSYEKGSLATYALQDYVGEDVVNGALKEYLQAVRFQEPPYTNSVELLDRLKKVAPAKLIEDLFETITLFENRAVSATQTPLGGDEHEVHLKVSAKKLRADDQGKETEQPLDDLIDVAVLDKNGEPLLMEKRRFTQKESELTLRVHGVPAKAGIDPFNKQTGRQPSQCGESEMTEQIADDAPGKPRAALTLGLLSIIFGALTVLTDGFNIIRSSALPDKVVKAAPPNLQELSAAYKSMWSYARAESDIMVVMSLALIVIGVGLRRQMKRARVAALIWAAAALAVVAARYALFVTKLRPTLLEVAHATMTAELAKLGKSADRANAIVSATVNATGIGNIALLAVFPIVLLILLNREAIKDQFTK